MTTGYWMRGLRSRCMAAGAAAAIVLMAAACSSSGAPTAGDTGTQATLPGDSDGGQTGSAPSLPGDDGGGQSGGNHQSEDPTPSSTPTLPATETDGTCPYIASQDAADMEGNRVGRTTVLSTTPPGCRFYFAYNLSQIVLEIGTQV
ncbi:MAG: hypothetical protein LBQ06_04890, partial [Frankiaceae bacterium]|nr:hypothetical protein [Frankiaceae bacterium]